ncbi:energy transducer TonB [Cellulophaga sp. HaHaR_3_176]|uniref:energy transducer TonB n=1 Tax=Cellulophaga sp. HaHaR_3_176 TaxID=1942464 RepID=UPI001C1FE6AD|nr:energy transducer TonB [Cellulophaga sp. HaHaR_3_176]QWX84072.1 energy transducer TonB [Cellulophaga sp. HaHaR_3_176]
MKKSTRSTADSHGNGSRNETSNGLTSKGTKHDVNLRKNGFIHFQIGLILAMFLVYFGLELAFSREKPPVLTHEDLSSEVLEFHSDANNFVVEKNKVVQQSNQKVNDPDKFKIVPDDVIINPKLEFKKDPEVDNTGVIDVSSIKPFKDPDIEEGIVIPFIALEDVPVFPGCEKVEKSERKACFEEKMQKHVLRTFRYPEAAIDMQEQGKVYAMFTIGKEGLIEDVKLRGPSKILENEAARIIGELPVMKPGKQRDLPVRVSFSMPIVFKLN